MMEVETTKTSQAHPQQSMGAQCCPSQTKEVLFFRPLSNWVKVAVSVSLDEFHCQHPANTHMLVQMTTQVVIYITRALFMTPPGSSLCWKCQRKHCRGLLTLS